MEISLQQLFKLMLKNMKLIVLCAAIGLVAAFLITKLLIAPTYVSTVKFYVSSPTDAQTTAQDMNALNYAQKVVNTYIQMLQTNQFYEKVVAQSALTYSPAQLQSMVSFSSLNGTEVFQAQATSKTPEEAKLIADVVAELASDTIKTFKEDASLKVVDAAVLPKGPASPNTKVNVLIGFMLGIIAAVLFVVLRDVFDVTIKNEDDLAEKYDIPVLAAIPLFDALIQK